MNVLIMLLSDLYRLIAAVVDFRAHLRAARGRPRYDVACIVNLERPQQKSFMGLWGRAKAVVFGLRFRLHGCLGRHLVIASTADDMETRAGRERAKQQLRRAIQRAANDGARVALFGSGTKRLLSADELEAIQREHPNLLFTIGDHGTSWALLQDVFVAIQSRAIATSDKIMVIGPSGFLGSVVTRALRRAGFDNLVPVSARDAAPFVGIDDVRLIVACSHHRRVRLTAEVLERVSHAAGVHVIDVCKPANLSRRHYAACPTHVTRQDAGNTFNPQLQYVFSPAAALFLGRLKLSLDRLYGCFSEAIAIACLPRLASAGYDFMSINDHAFELVARLLPAVGFSAPRAHNFGVADPARAPAGGSRCSRERPWSPPPVASPRAQPLGRAAA